MRGRTSSRSPARLRTGDVIDPLGEILVSTSITSGVLQRGTAALVEPLSRNDSAARSGCSSRSTPTRRSWKRRSGTSRWLAGSSPFERLMGEARRMGGASRVGDRELRRASRSRPSRVLTTSQLTVVSDRRAEPGDVVISGMQSRRSTWPSAASACRTSLPSPPYSSSTPRPPRGSRAGNRGRACRCRVRHGGGCGWCCWCRVSSP